MNINEFVSERKTDWRRLEDITRKFRPGKTPQLTKEELWQVGPLYTAAVSDLAVLKSSDAGTDPNNRTISYLNGLIIRAHGALYRKTPFKRRSISDFFVRGLPSVMRANIAYVAVSAGVFMFFSILGFVLSVTEPGFVEMVVPPGIIATVEDGEVWFSGLYRVAPQASSWLMTHNISVTFLAIAAGMTFGIGSIFLMALNGLLLGAVGGVCYTHDLSLELWSFVLPHGSVELSAIIIGGGAGLILGHALIDPGPYRRSEWLAHRGKDAATLALACIPLLVVAGITEAFFHRQNYHRG